MDKKFHDAASSILCDFLFTWIAFI